MIAALAIIAGLVATALLAAPDVPRRFTGRPKAQRSGAFALGRPLAFTGPVAVPQHGGASWGNEGIWLEDSPSGNPWRGFRMGCFLCDSSACRRLSWPDLQRSDGKRWSCIGRRSRSYCWRTRCGGRGTHEPAGLGGRVDWPVGRLPDDAGAVVDHRASGLRVPVRAGLSTVTGPPSWRGPARAEPPMGLGWPLASSVGLWPTSGVVGCIRLPSWASWADSGAVGRGRGGGVGQWFRPVRYGPS